MVRVMKRLTIMMALAITMMGCQAAEAALTKQDIQEIRQVIREELKPIEVRLDARIDGVEKRLDNLFTMLASIIALMGVMVGSVIWMARQDKPITQRHYEQILTREDRLEEELHALKKSFEALKPQSR